jgi:hypothetical protein
MTPFRLTLHDGNAYHAQMPGLQSTRHGDPASYSVLWPLTPPSRCLRALRSKRGGC